MYRRLSLSQRPGDQTKYFEISVVWDSQPVTSFIFSMYMYVELHIACTCISQLCTRETPIRWFAYLCVWMWNKRNVTDSPLCIHSKKMSVINACLARHFRKFICETHLSTSYNFSSTSVTFDCCLHQRTLLNCSVIKVTKAPLCIRGF